MLSDEAKEPRAEAAPVAQDKNINDDQVDEQSPSQRTEISEKYALRSHMDIVRGVQFLPSSLDTMASISEDCMVKLWNLAEMEKLYSYTDGNPEPFLTLRGHTGPLLAVTGLTENRKGSQNENLLFTAGIEGSIKVWSTPSVSDVNQYGSTFDGKNYCIGTWADTEQEAIWALKYHPYQDLLLAISANNAINVWDCSQLDKTADNQGKIKHRFSY